MHIRIINKLVLMFFVFTLVFVVFQLFAPFFLPPSTIRNLSGSVCIVDNGEKVEQIDLPWSIVYLIGDFMCHQRADRSFFVNGNQMPFCSRCTAIWLGLTVGLSVTVFRKIRLNNRFVFGMLLGLVPIGVDGLGQLFGLWESTNLVRVLTGLPAGFVCGLAVGVIVYESFECRS